MIEIFALSQAPVVALLAYIYLRDTDDKESPLLLFYSFLAGVGCAVPAAYLEYSLGAMQPTTTVYGTAVKIVLLIALVEESLKYIAVRTVAYNEEEFNEPYDGIMYAVSASLGFAAIENFLYVLQHGVTVGWFRMFTAVPLHAMAGIFMGFYLGMAKFCADELKERLYIACGVLSATLAHGAYNYMVMVNVDLLLPMAIVLLFLEAYLARKALRIYGRLFPRAHARGQSAAEYSLVSDATKWARAALTLGILFGLFWFGVWLSDQLLPAGTVFEILLPMAYSIGKLSGFCALLSAVLLWGLKTSRPWAWGLSLVSFVLLLPTPCFPLGLCGLYGLLRPIAEMRGGWLPSPNSVEAKGAERSQ